MALGLAFAAHGPFVVTNVPSKKDITQKLVHLAFWYLRNQDIYNVDIHSP